MLPWRGFLLRPTAAQKMVKMRRPSANTENSRRTREKPLVPRSCKCIRGIKNLQQPFEGWDMRAPIHYWRALTHDVAFCSQIFDIKGSILRRERALILMGAYLKLHAYFVSFFQSSPNLTKSLIFHWQCYNHCQKCREGYFFVYLFSFFLSLLAKCWIMRSIFFPVISQNWIGDRGGGGGRVFSERDNPLIQSLHL